MAVKGMMVRPQRTYVTIQYLRAFAATLVVYEHTFSNHIAAQRTWFKGYGLWGVDVFFVISGFIMGCSIADSHPSWQGFLTNRLCRVVPMYWLATTIWILSRLAIHDRLNNGDISLRSVVLSFLFLPQYHLVFSSRIWPVLVPGWTLQLELFFYGLLSLALCFMGTALARQAVFLILATLVAAGLLFHPTNAILAAYSSPILLEFAAGLVLARLRDVVALPGLWFGIPVGTLSLTLAYFGTELRLDERFAVLPLGLAAVLLVVAALSCDPALARRPSRPLLLLGNASYSLYLFHPIFTSLVAVIWVQASVPAGPDVFVVAAVCTSVAGAVLVHLNLECPLLSRIRQRSPRAAEAVMAARAVPL